MADKKDILSDDDKKKIRQNIMTIQLVAGSLGTIGGAVFAYKKQSGFWGYVGYILLGSIVFGSVGVIATAPMRSKLDTNY